jgi:hypothetical protein
VFQDWENYYLMLGPAAAGLIGLLFVVVTLTSGQDRSKVSRGQALYMTPTVVQFAVVLTVSAVAMAPRLAVSATAVATGVSALVGLANAARACLGIRALRKGKPEDPHWSDFWCYGVGPAVVYLGLCVTAVAIFVQAPWAAQATAASVLLLLLVGINNAWDLVTWIAPMRGGGGQG